MKTINFKNHTFYLEKDCLTIETKKGSSSRTKIDLEKVAILIYNLKNEYQGYKKLDSMPSFLNKEAPYVRQFRE